MKSVKEAKINNGTRVFVRCDIDVPLENGKILTTFRLDSIVPTLRYIIEKGGIPIIAGHISKPGGEYREELSTKHLKPYFNKNLGEGKYELLENLRFDPREEKNDKSFAQELSQKADFYVNESFATCHRKHASIVGITAFLPSYAGLRLQLETETLGKLNTPKKPFIVLIGGAKLESKMPVIERFLKTADRVLLAGLLSLEWSKEIPQNLVLAGDFRDGDKDISAATVEKYINIIGEAKTVLWAGPVGVYEKEEFIVGTKKIAEAIVNETQRESMYSVIGGGDMTAAAAKLGLINKFSFTSTGGGAMLNYLAEGTLPGIEALN